MVWGGFRGSPRTEVRLKHEKQVLRPLRSTQGPQDDNFGICFFLLALLWFCGFGVAEGDRAQHRNDEGQSDP